MRRLSVAVCGCNSSKLTWLPFLLHTLNCTYTVCGSVAEHRHFCLCDFRLLKQCRQFFELKCELMGSLTGWWFCWLIFIFRLLSSNRVADLMAIFWWTWVSRLSRWFWRVFGDKFCVVEFSFWHQPGESSVYLIIHDHRSLLLHLLHWWEKLLPLSRVKCMHEAMGR